MEGVSGATERPCPHRIRVVTHEYEDIYGRSTQNAKLFQSVISPKWALNPRYETNHNQPRILIDPRNVIVVVVGIQDHDHLPHLIRDGHLAPGDFAFEPIATFAANALWTSDNI